MIYGKKHIRVLNYHDTHFQNQGLFEKQLIFYKKFYEDVTEEEFQRFLKDGTWNKKKPGMIISFDDGLRSNYDYALPLLEKHGFTGWFCIPAGFADCKTLQQIDFSRTNFITAVQAYADERIAMSWDEIKDMNNRGHVIVNHTFSHHRMNDSDTEGVLQHEINYSNKLIKEKTNLEPAIFCWVGGEEISYTKKAFEKIKSNFRFGFMTNTFPVFPKTNKFFVERTNVEPFYPLHLVLFQLSGLMDILYYRKRKALRNKLLN